MLNWMKEKLRTNETVYFYARLLRRWRDKEFRDWVRSYAGWDTFLIKHPGEISPDKYVYCIREMGGGFFAEVTFALGELCYADTFHLTPVISWGSRCVYYESVPINDTENVFDYYFKPVSEISYTDIERYNNVIYSMINHSLIISPDHSRKNLLYGKRLSLVERYGLLYKKYFKLNGQTQNYIDEYLDNKINERKTLGVHVRGTDFKKQFNDHPVCISAADFVKPAREIMKKYGYKQLFLATDSLEALQLFQKEFGSNLVYYEDVLRSDGDVGVHYMEDNRKNHHYLLGLEVLRDAYTLTACDSLLAGMSNVSLAAQYIKYAEGATYDEVKILDYGINHNKNAFESSKEK